MYTWDDVITTADVNTGGPRSAAARDSDLMAANSAICPGGQ